MKLELNHIQHYPIGENGLKVLRTETLWSKDKCPKIKYQYKRKGRFLGYTNRRGIITTVGVSKETICAGGTKIIEVKPILHPLSDYKDVNSKAMNELNCDVMDMIRISELANQQIGLASVQYGVIEIMCDNHIDFNRLIESGLAIDINTL